MVVVVAVAVTFFPLEPTKLEFYVVVSLSLCVWMCVRVHVCVCVYRMCVNLAACLRFFLVSHSSVCLTRPLSYIRLDVRVSKRSFLLFVRSACRLFTTRSSGIPCVYKRFFFSIKCHGLTFLYAHI